MLTEAQVRAVSEEAKVGDHPRSSAAVCRTHGSPYRAGGPAEQERRRPMGAPACNPEVRIYETCGVRLDDRSL